MKVSTVLWNKNYRKSTCIFGTKWKCAYLIMCYWTIGASCCWSLIVFENIVILLLSMWWSLVRVLLVITLNAFFLIIVVALYVQELQRENQLLCTEAELVRVRVDSLSQILSIQEAELSKVSQSVLSCCVCEHDSVTKMLCVNHAWRACLLFYSIARRR